ncbi:hypothetical protein V8E36_000876 [Tilletia maclaganii]
MGSAQDVNLSRIVAESIRMNTPIIAISINYRLGVFGFLAGSTMLSSARSGNAALNAGLYDARMSLRWVKANIAAFGGDPDRVTLQGRSAGAFMTGSMLFANNANTEGLFHAVIMQSGVQPPMTLPPNHALNDKLFANLSSAVGCPAKPSSLACLRSVSANDLAYAANVIAVPYPINSQLGSYPFTPVQDALANGYFFPAPPRTLLEQGRFANVPVISGLNLDEGTGMAPTTLRNGAAFEAWFRQLAIANLANASDVNATLAKLFTTYFKNNVTLGSPYYAEGTAVSLAMTNTSDPFYSPATNQFKRAAALYAAWRFESFQRRFLLKRAQMGGKVWAYQFAQHDTDFGPERGVFHNAETAYVLGDPTNSRPAGVFYQPLSKQIQRAWIAFVNNYDPGRVGQLTWPAYDSSSRTAMQFKGLANKVIRDDARDEQLAYLMSPEVVRIFT